jgi:hypothetical protein
MDGTSLMRIPRLRGIALILALLISPISFADSSDTIRVAVASRLFPSMLAADMELEQKAGANHRLLILVVYLDDREMAEHAAREIKSVGSIRKRDLDVRIISLDTLTAYKDKTPAGIFIGDKLDESLAQVMTFAREHRIITFSPYSGDVEQGVAGGIQVRDRILPYVNLKTLRDSSINLRPFYLKVAETYEPK